MDTGKVRLKVVLVGEYGVGKSSLFRRFAYDTFVEHGDRSSTLGLDHFSKTYLIDGRSVALELWDTGGLERVASVTSSYFKHADGALLCFAVDEEESFHALSQHILEVVSSADAAKLFLCATRQDLQPAQGDAPVSDQDIQLFVRENQVSDTENLFTAQFKTSAKTGDGVHDMFREMAEALLRSSRQPRPDPDHFRLRSNSLAPPKDSSCCSSNGS